MKTNQLLLAVAASCGLLSIFNSAIAQTWTPTSAPSNYWLSVASSADGTRLVAVGGDGLYTSTNSGITWTSNGVPKGSAVASSADGTKLVVVGYRSIYFSVDSGATWTPASAPADYYYSVASSADGTKLVATSGGYVSLRSALSRAKRRGQVFIYVCPQVRPELNCHSPYPARINVFCGRVEL